MWKTKSRNLIIMADFAKAYVDVCIFFKSKRRQNKHIAMNKAVKLIAQTIQVPKKAVPDVEKKGNVGEGFKVLFMHYHDLVAPEEMLSVVSITKMKRYLEKCFYFGFNIFRSKSKSGNMTIYMALGQNYIA